MSQLEFIKVRLQEKGEISRNECLRQAKERWKTIPFAKNYQVSTFGNVRTKRHYVKHPKGGNKIVRKRVLKIYYKTKYLGVDLGYRNRFLVHRLVAIAFLKNPENKKCVNHIDGNTHNNNYQNLQWCTYSENELHSYKKLGKKANKNNLGNIGIKSASSIPVAQIDSNNKIISVFGSIAEANRLNGSLHVGDVCRGDYLSTKGHRYKFITKSQYFNYKETETRPTVKPDGSKGKDFVYKLKK